MAVELCKKGFRVECVINLKLPLEEIEMSHSKKLSQRHGVSK